MKKIILIIISIICLTSCSDYLSVKPTNILALANYDEVKALLGAHLKTYANPTSGDIKSPIIHYMGDKNFWLLFHIYSDDVDVTKYINTPLGNNNKVLLSTAVEWNNPDVAPKLWETYYLNIGFYNTIIDELSKVKSTQEQSDIVKQEAKVLRAWHLFKLMQYFSPYKMDKYGIPVNLNAQLVGEYDSDRKTQTEVYAIIINELTEALNCKTPPRETYNIFYDKKIINALLAQVYLFKGESGAKANEDYRNAITCAKAAMEGRTLQGIENYVPFPRFENRSGVIKNSSQYLLVDGRIDNVIQNITGGSSYKIHSTTALYSLYQDKDIRKTTYFDNTMIITKYSNINPIGSYSQFTPYNFFSIAEMHLIVAESYARLGENGEAKNWLESFQAKRIADYTSFAGGDILKEILDERRREFCFEYDMRWCDLVRIQKGWERNSYPGNENPISKMNDNDFKFCFPIPVLEELQYNDIEQNPGWKTNK